MSSRRILIVGCNGLLGQKILELFLRGSSASVTAASIEPEPVRPLQSVPYTMLDITSKKDVRQTVVSCEPHVIVNCAAMTNVDACETEREAAWRINVGGVENLVEAAKRVSASIVHVSSDYVFDGKSGPYTEEDRPRPLSYYGKTKLASENVLRTAGLPYFIARTMVLYGFAEGVRPNFALWLLDALQRGTSVTIVDDQIGNPTLVDDLAYGLMKAIELGKTGMYNIAGKDIMSRFEFAGRLARAFGLDESLVRRGKTDHLKQAAPRPLNSGLITLKAQAGLGFTPVGVDEGLAVLRSQLARSGRWMTDRASVPGKAGPRAASGRVR